MENRKTRLERLAKLISVITNPGLLTLFALVYVVSHYADSSKEFWQWVGVGSLLLILPGIVYTIWLWYRDKQIDLDISDRHERIVPLMLTSLGALITGVLIHGRASSPNLEVMSYVLVALLITLTIITVVWKISLHITTATALVSLVMYFRGVEAGYFYLILLPIAWSRLRLKQHTPAQLVGGALIGASVTLVLATIVSRY